MQTDQLFEYRAAMEELEVEYGSIEEIRWEAQHGPNIAEHQRPTLDQTTGWAIILATSKFG